MGRTSREIVDQTHALAVQFYRMFGYQHIEGKHAPLYESEHPTEMAMWQMACAAQLELTDTDPEDALSDLDEE